jgi:hypothetical protein
MTNLQEDSRGPLFGDRFAQRVLFWTPVAMGGGLAALVLLAGVVPSMVRSGSTQESLETARALAAQLPTARLQLEEERRRLERIQQQRATLLSLIGRPGTLATFLAEIDRLAAVEQVQLDLYEPQAAAAPASPGSPAAAATPPGPPAATAPGGPAARPGAPASAALQVEGLQSTTLLVSARGAYPALLRFLRSLERLDVLVAQSDLSLALEPAQAPATPQANPVPTQAPAPGSAAAAVPAVQAPAGATAAPNPAPRVVMKLAISLYEPAAAGQPGSQLPGRP